MKVIACIPELPQWPESVGPGPQTDPASPAFRATAVADENATPSAFGSAAADRPVANDGDESDAESDEEEGRPSVDRWTAPGRRRAMAVRFPTSSIVALAAVAVVVWVAAWRNDRLRLEATRHQRPDRIARELLPTTGAPSNPRP